jgi:TRAP-type mannitol/chloroaromatic compound transport system permease large subunit
MLRYGYDRRVATGVIAASGTLAQIIPPSLVLIVLADQLGRSVGDMYAGAIVPGLVLTGLYMGYVLLMTIIKPNSMPALPLEARTLGSGVMSLVVALVVAVAIAYGANRILIPHYGQNADIWGATIGIIVIYIAAILDKGLKIGLMSRLAQQVVIVLIPPLALIFLVLGTIFLGIATPTEGGAMGAVGALVMAAAKGRLSMDVVKQALASTTRLSSFVLFILIGARTFSLTFYGVNGHLWVEHLLLTVPGGELGFLIVVNILVFVLAFFLDFFELAFIIIPLLAPVADKLGIDLIWFGVLLGVNMQTSFMHPPFGFALFYLRSVAARVPYIDKITGKKIEPVTTGQIYWGAVPFVTIQVIMIALTIAFPQMVMRYKTGTAPEDVNKIKIEIPGLGGGGMGFNPFAPPGAGNSKSPGVGGTPPGLSGPPPGLGGTPAPGGGATKPAPTTPPATDLSQPPKFN